MSIMDIRQDKLVFNEIIFADVKCDSYIAHKVTQSSDERISIVSEDRYRIDVDASDVDNLILALQKAKELGWCGS